MKQATGKSGTVCMPIEYESLPTGVMGEFVVADETFKLLTDLYF